MKQTTLDQMFAKSKRSTRNNPQEQPKLELPLVSTPKQIQFPIEQIKSDQSNKPTKKLHHNIIKAMERKRIQEQKKKQRLGIIQEEQVPERQRSRGKKGRPPKIKKIIQQPKEIPSQNQNDQNNENSPDVISKQKQVSELSELKPRRRGRQPKIKAQTSDFKQKVDDQQEQIKKKLNNQIQKLQIQPIQIRIQINSDKQSKNKKTSAVLKNKVIQEKNIIHHQQHQKMDQQVNQPLELCVEQKKRQVKKIIKKGLKIQQKSEFTLYNKYFDTLIKIDKSQNNTNKLLDRPLIFDKFRHNNQYQQLLTAINQK